MAHVMLGNAAEAYGGCDKDSFAKGYEQGFHKGWELGFDQAIREGKKLGRRKAEAEFKGIKTDREFYSYFLSSFSGVPCSSRQVGLRR